MAFFLRGALWLSATLAWVQLRAADTPEWKSRLLKGRLKAFCVDFNWGPGGPNGFPAPGHWADADPVKHVAWYEQLGVNVIQTFAVSCNGYAWYKNGVVPEQPGLKHDFLTEVVKLGHARKMLVMGYYCVGANTRWGREHPELSYGTPSHPHLPFTDEYLDALAASIANALEQTGMDGFMIDWLWNPEEAVRRQATGGKWLAAEQKLYEQLLGQPFPGEAKLTAENRLAYERQAIDRCWARIHATAKRAKPDCIIWLSCNNVRHPALAGSRLLQQVDWMMNEAGTPATMQAIAPMFGTQTRPLLCLAGWGDAHPTRELLSNPDTAAFGIYGFSQPQPDSLPLSVETYLSRPIESFKGNDRSLAVLARFFNGKPFEFLAAPRTTPPP